MYWKPSLAAVLAFVSASFLANAQAVSEDATPAKGRTFALLVCAACHVVASDQRFAPILRNPGPSFDLIANKPATTAESLRAFLTTTHSTMSTSNTMPNPQLADYQINEVISYVLSLQTRK